MEQHLHQIIKPLNNLMEHQIITMEVNLHLIIKPLNLHMEHQVITMVHQLQQIIKPLNLHMEHQLIIMQHQLPQIIKHLKKIVILTDAMATVRQMINVSTEPMCSICFQDVVSLVSIPCGHTFCASCGGKQLNSCYICRVQVRERVKIYFS